MNPPERTLPSVLSNMSSRPSTNVRVVTGPSRGARVRFRALPAQGFCGQPNPGLERAAERAWRAHGFRGAALLFAWTPPPSAAPPREQTLELLDATDRLLCVNVLGRARGGLLLARTPLSLHPEHIGRELWSADARLVAFARSSGAKRVTT
jgi:hypothetical protein